MLFYEETKAETAASPDERYLKTLLACMPHSLISMFSLFFMSCALLDRSLYVDRLFGRRDDVRPRPKRGDRCGDAAGIRAVEGRTRATVALEALVGAEGRGEGAAVALEASKVLLAMDDARDGCSRPGGGCCRRDRCCVGATRGGRRARGDHRNVPRRWGRDAVS